MRNPLANEDAAFRLVLGTIAYLAPIVLASWVATWLGVVVFVVATAVVVTLLRRGRTSRDAPSTAGRAAVEDTISTHPEDNAARLEHEVAAAIRGFDGPEVSGDTPPAP